MLVIFIGPFLFLLLYTFTYSVEHSLSTTHPWFEGTRWWNTYHFVEETYGAVENYISQIVVFMRYGGSTLYHIVPDTFVEPLGWNDEHNDEVLTELEEKKKYFYDVPFFYNSYYFKDKWWSVLDKPTPDHYIKYRFFIDFKEFDENRHEYDNFHRNRKYVPDENFRFEDYFFEYDYKHYTFGITFYLKPIYFSPARFASYMLVDRVFYNQHQVNNYVFSRAGSRHNGRLFP